MKKPGLDAEDVSSCRPISNLPVLSKLLERLVAGQVMEYLSTSDLLPSFQSGFRAGHSTGSAVQSVLSDVLQAVDRGDIAALDLLNLSATFDTVDHDILLRHRRSRSSLVQDIFDWTVAVCASSPPAICNSASAVRRMYSMVLFSDLYCWFFFLADLILIVENSGLVPHL